MVVFKISVDHSVFTKVVDKAAMDKVFFTNFKDSKSIVLRLQIQSFVITFN